ncbi:MAG: hypothetical protein HQ445_02650 [Polaromonas sp.]|nr:hypothetical protein [Polaromonas sp.]
MLFSLFSRPSPVTIARRQLIDAQHSCLDAIAHREHADSIVAYRTAQIERLTAFLETVSPR